MKKIYRIAIAAVVLAGVGTWVYLSGPGETILPETESGVLNELLSSAPVSRIDLNAIREDTLMASFLELTRPSRSSDEMLERFQSTQVEVFGDYLVVMEFLTDNVAVFRKNGAFVRHLGGKDIIQAASLMSDGESLFVYDYGDARLHRYNRDLQYQESIPFSAPYYAQGSVTMNRNHIILQHEEATGFRVGESRDSLLIVVDKNDPDKEVFKAIQRIVPSGKHPGGFNNLVFSANDRSEIVAGFPALSYLFLFRNFEHVHTISLQTPDFDSVDNPPLTPFQPVMGEAVRIQNLIDQVHLTENGEILVFSFGLLHHLKPRRSGQFIHHKSYRVLNVRDESPVESVSSIGSSPDDSNTLYITSRGKVIRLDIPK